MDSKIPVTSLTIAQLEEHCIKIDEPKYRAKQLIDWVYKKSVFDFNLMTNLSEETKNKFSKYFSLITSRIKQTLTSKDETKKLLIELSDYKCIETVLLRDADRITICISTQVGCPVKCNFCASGKKGLIRSLNANEIVEQVLLARNLIHPEKINNVVVMGMGEPFLNYDNFIKALTIITQQQGLGIGTNRITTSTVGIPEKTERFSKEKVATNLAISLHAPNDDLRKEIIPLATKYSIKSISQAAKNYHSAVRKDLTFEYLLLEGLNTSSRCAAELAKLVKTTGGKINLIAYNEVKDLPYRQPSQKTIKEFQTILLNSGIITMLRKSRGQDIAAACGQLALIK